MTFEIVPVVFRNYGEIARSSSPGNPQIAHDAPINSDFVF
jgi:hypothetical protein